MFLKPQYWFQVTAGLRRRWRKDKKIAGERKRPIWGDLSDWPQSLHQTNNSQCTTKLAKGTEMINQLTDTFHFIFWEISNYCLLQSTGNNFGPVKYWLYITSFISFMCLPFSLLFCKISIRFWQIYPGKWFGSAFSYFHAIKRFYGQNGIRHAKMIGIRGQAMTFAFLCQIPFIRMNLI